MTPALVEVLVSQVRNLQRYATEDPRERVRRDADERLTKAFEAALGVDWTTIDKMAIVFSIRTAAKEHRDAPSVIVEHADLAGHEEKIQAAIDGFTAGARAWPLVVDLLEAAGLLTIEGGNPKALQRARRQAAESLSRTWRKVDAQHDGVFQPFGYRPD